MTLLLRRFTHSRHLILRLVNHTETRGQSQIPSYESKYAKQLNRLAKEKGLSVDELRVRAREERESSRKRAAEREAEDVKVSSVSPSPSAYRSTPVPSIRNDSSPIKPLSTLLNLPRLLQTPHTPSQVSALWTAYHASRSNGTGRGYVCASVPEEAYQKMIHVARRYDSFVVPLSRVAVGESETRREKAYEFYFVQWAFHGSPPQPAASTPEPFSPATPKSTLPQISTILFTPLAEYKLRSTFATPYLALTMYPDLVGTHKIVLLRGEITASSGAADGNGEGRWMLSQEDAQMLVMGVQRFYLWGQGDGGGDAERLLKIFHEKPEEFKWEELLKHAM